MKKIGLILLGLLAFVTSAYADCTGQFQAGYTCGNPTSSNPGRITGAPLTTFLDLNFGTTQGSVLERGPSGWVSLLVGAPITVSPNLTLSFDSNFTVSSSQLALAPIASGHMLANGGASSAEPTDTTWTAFASKAIGTSTGMIPEYNGSSWATLLIGTSGGTIPLNNGNNNSTGLWSFSNINVTGGTITGLPNPSNASDAATKSYVDSAAAGLTVHTPVSLATTGALPANTYNNGASGVGATLTANANGNLVIDGTTNPSATTRILVKNEATAVNNGIYVVTTTGGASQAYVLTRATDANTPGTQDPNKIGLGTFVLVSTGTANVGSQWSVNSTVTTIGTSAINWSQFGAAFNGVASLGGQSGVLGIDSTLHYTSTNLGLNLGTRNNWTGGIEITANGGSVTPLEMNTPSTGQFADIQFEDAGTGKWQIGKFTNNAFYLFNVATSHNNMLIGPGTDAMQLVPSAGSATIGNSVYADNSGHPYCDVRNAGGGQGNVTNDVAAFNSVYSNCSGGLVFIPCGGYLLNTNIVVPPGTHTVGAGIACVTITQQSTTADAFTCTNSSTNSHTEFDHFTILGTGAVNTGTVPTGGWAINCNQSGIGGGNAELFHDLEINGTFNGVAVGGTNSHFDHNRVEGIYGAYLVYCPNGGCTIEDNQLDNNSAFNATGGIGFGTFAVYNTGTPTAYALGEIVQSNGEYYVVTQAGTSAPQGGGLPAHPMFYNICDGGSGGGVSPCSALTFQLIGTASLVVAYSGTETWIQNNDMTSPAHETIYLDGPSGGLGTVLDWINNNDIAGSVLCGLCYNHAASNNTAIGNKFQFVGYNFAGAATGFPVWDLTAGGGGAGDSGNNTITNNIFFAFVPDAAIVIGSDFWIISNNNIVTHNNVGATQCAIELVVSSGSPAGTTITGNIIQNVSPGAICGGADRTTATGNTVFGGTINLTGTNHVSTGNN